MRSTVPFGAFLLTFAAPLAAQELPSVVPGPATDLIVQSPIVTLDQESLFARSAFGLRVKADLEEASRALAAENRAIEASLAAEEQNLTTRRATLDAQEFRRLADAFDEKVVATRATQDGKLKELQSREEAERRAFYEAASPILQIILRDIGAVAILDSRAVVLSAIPIDITQEAIARIDARIGRRIEAIKPGGN